MNRRGFLQSMAGGSLAAGLIPFAARAAETDTAQPGKAAAPRAKGTTVETFAVKVNLRPAPTEVARALRVPVETKVLCVGRVRGWEGQPEVHFRSCLHPRLGLTKESDFHQPLCDLIQDQCSIAADQSVEEFIAVAADKRLARLLEVPVGTPLLRRERTVLDTGRKPVEFAMVHYRCDRFRLTLSLRQE